MAELISERALAKETGVGRSAFKALRDAADPTVVEGEDWLLSGNYVAWTPEGAEKAKVLLGIGAPEKSPPPAPPPAPAPEKGAPEPGEARRFEVARLVRNPKLLLCYALGDRNGEEHRVRVRAAENFVRGMELEAAWDAGGDCWVMLGRCPRRKGRW